MSPLDDVEPDESNSTLNPLTPSALHSGLSSGCAHDTSYPSRAAHAATTGLISSISAASSRLLYAPTLDRMGQSLTVSSNRAELGTPANSRTGLNVAMGSSRRSSYRICA